MKHAGLEGLDIAFVAGTLARGGAERQLFYVLRALTEAGARARLLSLTAGEAWEAPIRDLGIPIEWVGRHPSRTVRLWTITRRLLRNKPDIVQSQHFYTNLYVALSARAIRRLGIGALRNDCVSEVAASGWLGDMSLRSPRLLVANSRAAVRNAVSRGVPEARLVFLPNPVDADEFACIREKNEREPTRIIAVGRLVPQKRFDRLIRVVTEQERRQPGRAEVLIVGDGPLRLELEAAARQANLGPRTLRFAGQVTDVRPLYAWADILVQTSDYEGTPNVVLEAMASGLPVLATPAGDTADVCPHEATGLIVSGEDEAAMVRALTRLAEDEGLRRRLGEAGAARVRDHYSPAALAGLLEGIYRAAGVLASQTSTA